MGNLTGKSKRKKRMGCSSSTNEDPNANSDSEQKFPENPTDLRVLYEAIRDADALRQNGEIENAVVILSNAFDNALSKLGEVPDTLHQDTVLIMQIMKECIAAWKQKNVGYNPPYRRLKHLKLDQNLENDGDENLGEPIQQDPDGPAADQKVDENNKIEEKAARLKKKSPVTFDDSKIQIKPVEPIEVNKGLKPLFSSSSISFISDPTDVDQLYMSLWRADKLRIDNKLDDALAIVSETFDDCIHNLHSVNKKDKPTINEILQVFRETQLHWENDEENYMPDFDRLRNLKIDYQAAENAV